MLPGGRITAEDGYAYAKFARAALGTNDIDFRARPLSAEEASFLAAHVVLTGPGNGAATYADLERANTVLLAGFEPEDEAGAVFLRLRKANHGSGTKVVSIAPYTSRGLRKMGGTLVPTAPGDEAAALDALGMTGDHPLDSTSVIMVGERLATSPGALSSALGLASRTGARLAWVPRRAGDRGAIETGCLPHLLPGGRPVADAQARVDVATTWGLETLPESPGRDADQIVAAVNAGELGGLVVGGVDPDDTADPAAFRAALDAASFVVALELRETDVTRAADVVFPVAAVGRQGRHLRDLGGPPALVRRDLHQPAGAARQPGAGGDRRGARSPAGLPHGRRGARPDGGPRPVGRRPRRAWTRSSTASRPRPPPRAWPWPPGSSCSTTARCRTATTTCAPPPATRSPGSARPSSTPAATP